MKKIIALFASLVLLVPCLCIVGCSNSGNPKTVEYEEVQLTTSNYTNYIAFNAEITDYTLIELDTPHTTGQSYYTASVVVRLTTASKGADYRFKDVKIEYASKTTLIWQTGSGVLMPTASLDYKGDSQCSYVVLAENKLLSALSPTIFTSTKNMASAVEGYVLVPKT